MNADMINRYCENLNVPNTSTPLYAIIGPIAQHIAAPNAKLSPVIENGKYVSNELPLNLLSNIFLGYDLSITRNSLDRHKKQLHCIRKNFQFCEYNVVDRCIGCFTLCADGQMYFISSSYSKESWHYALSDQKIGFDISDMMDFTRLKYDIFPLINLGFPKSKVDHILPYILSFCAAEAVSKLLEIGLNRDILKISYLGPPPDFTLKQEINVRGKRITLHNVSDSLSSEVCFSDKKCGVVALYSKGNNIIN